MKPIAKCGTVVTVKDGRIACPVCGKRTDFAVMSNTSGINIPVFCRQCKTRTMVNIDRGQCSRSQCPE